MEAQPTAEEIKKAQEDERVMREMMPFFVLALIPIAITLAIAVVFAPNMTLP